MMMEEISDDTNGESTFEFVGGKNDEPSMGEYLSTGDNKDHGPPVTAGSANAFVSNFSSGTIDPIPPQTGSSLLQSECGIKFYDPAEYSSSSSVMMTQFPVPSQLPLSTMPSHFPTQTVPDIRSESTKQNVTVFPSVPLQQPNVAENFKITYTDPYAISEEHIRKISQDASSSASGVWGWIKNTRFLNKVAKKAKSSVDSVITTLDPGMKEIINSGGDINILVASENQTKVSAVREAFQFVFGKATVEGISVQATSIAPQPVGFSVGLKAAEERINNLRQQGVLQENQAVLAIENFLVELTPENWFDVGCLYLQDFVSNISLQVYTEAIPVSSQFVSQAKEQTPSGYPLEWSGYAITIGQIVGTALGVKNSEWHEALTGVSRREILFIAAKTIAGLYKDQLRLLNVTV